MRYSEQWVSPEDVEAVSEVLRSPHLTQGPVVERFEAALAEYVGARYCVAVNSGTAALHLVYSQIPLAGIRVPALSFVATANAALMAGKQVLFNDVDRDTGNVEDMPRGGIMLPSADVVVHFAGRASRIVKGGRSSMSVPGPVVVEDACHALGATDYDGCSKVGSCAHSLATVFSFHPVKPITTGEGGAVTTNDQGLAEELRCLRSHGRDASGLMQRLGYNYRMSELSAALGLSQLKTCDLRREQRLGLARHYVLQFDEWFQSEGRGPQAPGIVSPDTGAYHLYPVRFSTGRDEVKRRLNAMGIGAQVHYSPIIPLQPYYRDRFGYKEGQWPEAEAWAAEELSLPLHAKMSFKDVEDVMTVLRSICL